MTDIRQTIIALMEGCEVVTEGPWMAAKGGTSILGLPIVAMPMGTVIANCMWAPENMPHAKELNAMAQSRADHIARCDPQTIRAICELAIKGLDAKGKEK